MKPAPPAPAAIEAYIAACPPKVQVLLRKIRTTIQKAAPEATEKISYRMPAFFWNGALVYFGAFQDHIGFYPPVRDEALRREAASFANDKGNLRFPLDRPPPYALIAKLVQARVRENTARAERNKLKKRRASK